MRAVGWEEKLGGGGGVVGVKDRSGEARLFYESDWGMNKVFSSRLELHELRVMAFDFSY